jgi:hypothetical protein
MKSDLMRSPIIDAQGEGSSADVQPQRPPGKWLLEDALSQVAGEEDAIGAIARKSAKKPSFRHPKVLCLIDYGMIKGSAADRF